MLELIVALCPMGAPMCEIHRYKQTYEIFEECQADYFNNHRDSVMAAASVAWPQGGKALAFCTSNPVEWVKCMVDPTTTQAECDELAAEES